MADQGEARLREGGARAGGGVSASVVRRWKRARGGRSRVPKSRAVELSSQVSFVLSWLCLWGSCKEGEVGCAVPSAAWGVQMACGGERLRVRSASGPLPEEGHVRVCAEGAR